MLGKPSHRYQDYETFAGLRALYMGNEDIVIQQPAALKTILMLVGSDNITWELQQFAIKTLHDLFLQNDTVKEIMLENGLINALCDLFFPLLKKKTNQKMETTSKNDSDLIPADEPTESMQSIATNDNQISSCSDSENVNIEMESDYNFSWKVEEDILLFLKTIGLYGCMADMKLQLVEEILLVSINNYLISYMQPTFADPTHASLRGS
jgi:hypothetical protein